MTGRFTFRVLPLFLGAASLFAVLLFRVFDVQLLRGTDFLSQAEDNRFYSITQPADRGIIFDRFNQPLVWNTRHYTKLINPEALHSQSEPISQGEALQLLATDSAKVQKQTFRHYRYPQSLAHVLGYIGPVTAEELEENNTLSLHHLQGKMGLERFFNQKLMGKDGEDVYEINAQTNRQRRVKKVEQVTGQAISTSLDPDLSQAAYLAMDGQKGSVVVMDADSGEVLSLVNSPSFDPTLFSEPSLTEADRVTRQKELNVLVSSEDQPFFNRAVSGVYPPGSVFKLVTAMAGLEDDAFDEGTTVLDEGTLKVGDFEYGNWYFRQFGRTEGEIGLVRAIARSNDIFFYKAAEWTGPTALAEMARLMGLGVITGIEVGPEGKGIVPDPVWKEETLGERWYLGNTYHFGIGQGDVLVSPIQIARMVQSLANDGQICQPTVLKTDNPECSSLGFTDEHLKLVLRGMLEACSPTGTAFPFFPRNEVLRGEDGDVIADLRRGAIACKTGTAEFGGADGRGYRDTHGWWVGIVEPQIEEETDLDLEVLFEAATEDESSEEDSGEEAGLKDEVAEVDPVVPNRNLWLEKVKEAGGYPRRLVIVVLVESDEGNQYKEGSRDAAPVGEKILQWVEGREY